MVSQQVKTNNAEWNFFKVHLTRRHAWVPMLKKSGKLGVTIQMKLQMPLNQNLTQLYISIQLLPPVLCFYFPNESPRSE